MIPPISGIFVSSSTDAFIRLSRLLNFWASILAVFAPTWGIPNPNINLSNELALEFSIAYNKLVILFSPNPSNLFKSFSWFFNKYISWIFFINPKL